MLYMTSLVLIYLLTGSLYILAAFHPIHPLYHPKMGFHKAEDNTKMREISFPDLKSFPTFVGKQFRDIYLQL